MSFTKPTNGAFDYPTQIGRLVDIVEGPALRNFIRNGDFMVAQRGTSFAGITTAQYTLDGWSAAANGTNTVTQQAFTVGQTAVPGNPLFFLRHQRTVAAGALNEIMGAPIEFPQRLSGKTVTFSFWAKVSSGTKVVDVDLITSGVTPSIQTASQANTVTTTWTLFTYTVAVPAMTAATSSAYIRPRFTELSSLGTFTLDIADVQLELGSEATYFERLNYGEQMRWAQRFLPGFQSTGTQAAIPGAGPAGSTTICAFNVPFPVQARAAVSGISASAGSHFTLADGAGTIAATSIAFSYASKDACVVNITVASGLTQFRPYTAYFNNASGYLVFTGAEL